MRFAALTHTYLAMRGSGATKAKLLTALVGCYNSQFMILRFFSIFFSHFTGFTLCALFVSLIYKRTKAPRAYLSMRRVRLSPHFRCKLRQWQKQKTKYINDRTQAHRHTHISTYICIVK